jgi:2-polyprenyl-3-methyl-5-hydroxy-6-metoxy-1,4-benzoquinol methylase
MSISKKTRQIISSGSSLEPIIGFSRAVRVLKNIMSKSNNKISDQYSNPKTAGLYNQTNEHYPLEKEFYLNLAKEISAQKIIDIGCGTGLLTLELAKVGYEMIGVEPGKAMLEVAWQNPDSNKVKWIYGDSLLLEEENADLVIMTTHVAQELVEDSYFADVLNSINKSLKVGGHLTFDSRNSEIKVEDFNWPTKDKPSKFLNTENHQMLLWVNILKNTNNRVMYELHYFNTETKEELVSTNELVFRTQKQITEFLNQNNFEVENVYGNWDKTPVTSTSPEFIFVARKTQK